MNKAVGTGSRIAELRFRPGDPRGRILRHSRRLAGTVSPSAATAFRIPGVDTIPGGG